MHLIAWLLCGLLSGCVVGFLMRGRGYGLLGDLALGVAGGLLGGKIFHELRGGPDVAGWPAHVLVAVVGGCVLVVGWRIARRALGGGSVARD